VNWTTYALKLEMLAAEHQRGAAAQTFPCDFMDFLGSATRGRDGPQPEGRYRFQKIR
jgi:hypothetical protein